MSLRFRAAVVGCLATLGACSSMGPGTVSHDRLDYGLAIGDSWKEQTLLNIVKLRYADVPVFLEPTQVIAGYQLQGTLASSFTAGNSNASQIGPFTTSGTLAAGGSYTDRPTVIYSPLTGTDFLKRLMTPLPPTAVLFVLQSGYAADRMMPIMVDSINGLQNQSNRLNRKADPRYLRLIALIKEAQLAGTLQFRIERAKDEAESAIFAFGPPRDPDVAAKGQEIRRLLGLKPDIREIKVHYGAYANKDDEIDITSRSMLQIMLEFAAYVDVPDGDLSSGKASPSMFEDGAMEPPMRIGSSSDRPPEAYAAVRYGGRWFWIANTDIRSKTMFGVVILLFSVADTGIRSAAPVVTVPAQ